MTAELLPWLLTHPGLAALVFARTAGMAWSAPALATPGLGARFRVLLALALGVVVAPAVLANSASEAVMGVPPWAVLGRACLVEALVGAALGWSAALVVAGARQAGEIVGAQAGFSAAALFDPEAGDEMTAFGHLYGLVALALFLALDGPLTLVRALVESYRLVPAGGGTLSLSEPFAVDQALAFTFGGVGQALALALRASAPVAVALALTGLALGLIGRAAPSLHRAALMMPIRAAIGLTLVLLGLAALAATLVSAWGDWPGPAFATLVARGDTSTWRA